MGCEAILCPVRSMQLFMKRGLAYFHMSLFAQAIDDFVMVSEGFPLCVVTERHVNMLAQHARLCLPAKNSAKASRALFLLFSCSAVVYRRWHTVQPPCPTMR